MYKTQEEVQARFEGHVIPLVKKLLGVEVRLLDRKKFGRRPHGGTQSFGAPFSCHFDIIKPKHAPPYVTMCVDAFQYSEEPGNLFHELGHICCSERPPAVSELSEFEFMGWEFMLARECGEVSLWLLSMRDYNIGVDGEVDGMGLFGELSAEGQTAVLENRIDVAKEHGFLDDNLVPIRKYKNWVRPALGGTSGL